MIWVAWRQYRLQFLVAGGLLVALAVVVIITGLELRHAVHDLGGIRYCRAVAICYRATDRYGWLSAGLGPLLLAIPALLGMFWGVPLVAAEFESGTYRLAWTQSVTRRQWMTRKLIVVGVAALVVTLVLTGLVDWWYAPIDAAKADRLHPDIFTQRGIVSIGYGTLAFALGVGAGALTRRVLPALGLTLAAFGAARLAFTVWVRPHLLADAHAVIAYNAPSRGRTIPNAWVISDLVRRSPVALSRVQWRADARLGCRLTGVTRCRPVEKDPGRALLRHLTYQPAGHYWPLQLIETGLFLLAGVAVLWVTIQQFAPRPAASPPAPERPAMRLLPMTTPDTGPEPDMNLARLHVPVD